MPIVDEMTAVQELLEAIRIGEPVSHGALTVVPLLRPLLGPGSAEPDWLTLTEAGDQVTIEEIDEGGPVPTPRPRSRGRWVRSCICAGGGSGSTRWPRPGSSHARGLASARATRPTPWAGSRRWGCARSPPACSRW